MIRIEIGQRHYLLYPLLPHPAKVALLSEASRAKLDRTNAMFNETLYSGAAARGYDAAHRYGAADQREYPARALVTDVCPAPDMVAPWSSARGAATSPSSSRATPRKSSPWSRSPTDAGRSRRDAQRPASPTYAPSNAPRPTSTTCRPRVSTRPSSSRACIISTAARPSSARWVVSSVPGGRRCLVEPYHGVRRILWLLRKYLTQYRAPSFRRNERNWSTHDFVTRAEMRALCRAGGFHDGRFTGYWLPLSRRLVADPIRRMRLETRLSRLPIVRLAPAVLAIEARRCLAGDT